MRYVYLIQNDNFGGNGDTLLIAREIIPEVNWQLEHRRFISQIELAKFNSSEFLNYMKYHLMRKLSDDVQKWEEEGRPVT